MKALPYLVLGFIGLAVVWAYRRHTLDDFLGLSTPHGVSDAPSSSVTIRRETATVAKPYGPSFDGSTVVTSNSSAPSGPVFSTAFSTALGKVHGDGGSRDPQIVTHGDDATDGHTWATKWVPFDPSILGETWGRQFPKSQVFGGYGKNY